MRVYAQKVYNYFNAAVRAFIPLCLLIYLNYKIIRILYNNNKTRKRSNSSRNNPTKTKSKVTTMLLVIIFTFVVCVFPDAIMTAMHLGYLNENFLIRSIREVTDLLLAINSATTSIICYYFSIQYRQKLKQIFGFKANGEIIDDMDESPNKQERKRLTTVKSQEKP